jgi:hypothetical protein
MFDHRHFFAHASNRMNYPIFLIGIDNQNLDTLTSGAQSSLRQYALRILLASSAKSSPK